MENIRKFFKYLLTGQFGKLIAALRERVPGSVYRHGKAYILEREKVSQDSNNAKTPRTASDFVFRLLKEKELAVSSKLIGIPLRECCRRYDAGDFCFGAFYMGKLVNLGWVHQGSFYVKGMGYYQDSKENIAFTYNSVTEPGYRRKGIHKKSIYLRSKLLFEKGVSKIVTIVMFNNQISMNNLECMGFKKTKKLWHLAILGVKYTVIEDLESKDLSRKVFLRIPKGVHVI
jgi:hypothetical protein